VVAPPTDEAALRRAELADFLRARRTALKPEDVGLPGGGRRRTPGLRREELAALAGVGTTWYTWLEQGRDVRASLGVLDALAKALRLTPAERAHLIRLGRGETPAPLPAEREVVSDTLRRLVDSFDFPAYLLGRRYDHLAYNRATEALFPALRDVPPAERNQLWLVFTHPAWRTLYTSWEEQARRLLARFRAGYSDQIGDPAFEELVERLMNASPEFREWWPRHEVVGPGEGRKRILHPTAGWLEFEHAVFRHAENSDQLLVMYSPVPGSATGARLRELVSRMPDR
jgi:transcriptional regulator with XRE-family HTH domain